MRNFNLKRVWVEASLCNNAVIKLTSKNQIHHLSTVLRIKSGENIRIFNQIDGEWLANIQGISKKEVIIQIKNQFREHQITNDVILAFAPIKQDRLRFLIEKCTELGVSAFIPVTTERTTTRNINLTKLNTYTIAAAEQSERLSVPIIKNVISLKVLLGTYENYKIVFCDERSNNDFISNVLRKFSVTEKLIILTGPEGGFSVTERKYLTTHKNIYPVSLGENILRAETAAIFALSCYIISHK